MNVGRRFPGRHGNTSKNDDGIDDDGGGDTEGVTTGEGGDVVDDDEDIAYDLEKSLISTME
jgi:hypothetical protein